MADPTPTKTLIKQGAEAHLYHTTFLTPALPALLKHRPSKPYRHPILDARLTKHRCLSEARLLVRMRRELDKARITSGLRGVAVPAVYFVDEARGEIFMEWIAGRTLRDELDEALHSASTSPPTSTPTLSPPPDLRSLMARIGAAVAAMHAVDVVHGDLTTSNIMLRPLPDGNAWGEVVLIDFGLGSVSTSDEDMAVDLYVLERAFVSTHPRAEELLKEVLVGYERGMGKKGAQVMRRLAEVRLRGRKRSMLG
ncbi:kinase-like domain-containing protein [Tirmania nivea]|nr:kinase-like domain-containing protein [Tirmania nivea]